MSSNNPILNSSNISQQYLAAAAALANSAGLNYAVPGATPGNFINVNGLTTGAIPIGGGYVIQFGANQVPAQVYYAYIAANPGAVGVLVSSP